LKAISCIWPAWITWFNILCIIEVPQHFIVSREHYHVHTNEEGATKNNTNDPKEGFHIFHLLCSKGASILVFGQVDPGIGFVLPIGEGTPLARVLVLNCIAQDLDNQIERVVGRRLYN
jgi:hypothetical protein